MRIDGAAVGAATRRLSALQHGQVLPGLLLARRLCSPACLPPPHAGRAGHRRAVRHDWMEVLSGAAVGRDAEAVKQGLDCLPQQPEMSSWSVSEALLPPPLHFTMSCGCRARCSC